MVPKYRFCFFISMGCFVLLGFGRPAGESMSGGAVSEVTALAMIEQASIQASYETGSLVGQTGASLHAAVL